MEDKNLITLKKPIQAHGEEVKEILLREPTGKDIRVNGYPFTMNTDGQVVLLGSVVCKYVGTLADLPPGSVDQLSATDLNALGWAIAGFFLQA